MAKIDREAVRVAIVQDVMRVEELKLYVYNEDGSIRLTSFAVGLMVDSICKLFSLPGRA